MYPVITLDEEREDKNRGRFVFLIIRAEGKVDAFIYLAPYDIERIDKTKSLRYLKASVVQHTQRK